LDDFSVVADQVAVPIFGAFVDHRQGALLVGDKLVYQHGPGKLPKLRYGMKKQI
jgi:hypothetical protein